MAASTGAVNGDRSQSLSQSLFNQFQPLEAKLEALQQEWQSLQSRCQEGCTSSLRDSMESLYEVVDHANKNDKKLIDWHHRSDKVKGVLRLVGVDHRTHILVEEKTEKIRQKVQEVERKWDQTNGVFSESVEAATYLKREYLEFSVDSLGEFSNEAIQAEKNYEGYREELESGIREYEAKQDDEDERAESVSKSIRQAEGSCHRAKTRRIAWNMVDEDLHMVEALADKRCRVRWGALLLPQSQLGGLCVLLS